MKHDKWLLKTLLIVILTLCMPLCAMADEVSNMFVGTVDGEEIVAYLDYTYVTYFSGLNDDLDAKFVAFDEGGEPLLSIGVRLNDSTSERTYSEGNGKKIDYVYISRCFQFDTYKFYDYYRIVEGATDWKVTFTEIDRKNGIYKGTVKATLLPSKYNKEPYPFRESVRIEGSFEFQARTIHPMMEAYRARSPLYAKAHDVPYATTVGGYSSYDSTGSTAASSGASRCFSCSGDGRCSACGGDGKLGAVSSFVLGNACRTCYGSGRCPWCGGDGVR